MASNGNNDKSLESWIWDAACSIRGAKDAPKYKEYILPLIFAKRLCDVFDDELNRIAKEVGSRAKAFKLVKHDKKLVRFFLPLEPKNPDDPVWSIIRKLADKIGEQLTTLLLIEEPEAHLHPHLQVLLLRHLANVAAAEAGNEVQVIASSHSPILASQAPIDSIISIQECDGKVTAVSVCSIDMEEKLKKKLRRFLDATRGELFFARRLLMVEGIAESLLLPVLAKLVGGSLKESAVTVLNADGINFNCFLPLFGEKRLGFPVAILTDGDASAIGDPPSATATGLKSKETDIPNLRVQFSERTFEHELARSAEILPLMLDAFEILHPIAGKELKEGIVELESSDKKADAFLDAFTKARTSKGSFAQDLAVLLEASNVKSEAVPNYIRNVLEFLGVSKNGKAGDTAGPNPVAKSD